MYPNKCSWSYIQEIGSPVKYYHQRIIANFIIISLSNTSGSGLGRGRWNITKQNQ